MAHEKPARRHVDQRGRRSRTLYRKLNKCKCKVLLVKEGAENGLLELLSCIACMTICCSVHKSALTYKEIIFSTFSNPLSTLYLHLFLFPVQSPRPTPTLVYETAGRFFVRHSVYIYIYI